MLKKKAKYKVIDVSSEWFESPFAMIIYEDVPYGKPLSEAEAVIIVNWLNSITE